MNADIEKLVDLSAQAMQLKNDGKWDAAVALFEQILRTQPDWEHGYGAFNLAECYEQLGRISEARVAYERAVQAMLTDRTLLGGLASFLFLHGSAHEAFDQHLRLLKLERSQGDLAGVAATISALTSLGDKLGWSKTEVESQIL